MAKRKCMNKRLSRYSRISTCSDLLDPDTDIVGNEYPYWWKNLENNTIMRPSMGSDMLEQSSRHLDTNSQIEASKVKDGWWNVLEYSDTPDTSKMYKNIVEKKAAVTTLTSESEEEPKIIKKKIALRTKVQEPKGNVFLDALNDSMITTVSESILKTKKKSSTNNSASSSKTIANVGRSNEMQEKSSNQSHSANDILKVKPNIYKKNSKRASENLFADVLKEGELESSPKGKSVIISSNRKSLIVSGQTEALVPSQTKTNRFVFSFENEQDFSPLRVPNAQSTILEDSCSSMSDTNNNREHEILKPKPKFFVRQNKITGRNLFEKILESSESSDTGQKSESVNKSSKAIERSLKPLENVQTSKESTVEKDKTGRVKELKILNRSKEKHKIGRSGMKSAQNIKGFDKNNLQTENSVSSSDISDVSQNFPVVQKLKPKFLTKSRKNGENNLFQHILTDDDLDLGPLVSSKSKTSLDRSKIENSVIENVTLIQEQSKNDEDDQESSGESTKLQISGVSSDEDIMTPSKSNRISRKASEVSPVKDQSKQWNKSEANDVQIIPKKRSKILSTSNKEEAPLDITTQELEPEPPLHAAEEEPEPTQYDNEAIPVRRSSRLANSQKPLKNSSKRQSGRLSQSQERPIVRTTNQSKAEEIEGTTKRSSRSQGRVQKEQVSTVIEDAETLKSQESSKKQSGRLSKTRKRSSKRTMGAFEAEEVESTEKRSSKRQKGVQKESASAVAEEPEAIKDRDSPKKQRDRSSKTQKRLSARTVSESEPEEIESTAKRSSKGQNRAQKESVSAVVEKAEVIKSQDSSKRQDGRLSRSQILSIFETTSESEPEEIENTAKRGSRSENRLQKEVVLASVEKTESSRNHSDSKKHSERLSKLPKHSLAEPVFEVEPEETEITSKRNKSRSRTQQEQVSSAAEEAESIKNQGTLKRQSNRLSKSQERTIARSRSESKSKEDESTVKRGSRSQNRMQKESVSAAVEKTDSIKNQSDTKRHSERLSKLTERSFAESVFEFEPEETEITLKRNSRNRVRVQKKSNSVTAEKTESIENQGDSKKQSDRPSKSHGRSIMWSMSESDSEEIEIAPKRDESQNKIQEESVPRVVDGTESIRDLDTPKRQIDHLNKSQKRSLVQIISQSGSDGTGITLEQHRSQSKVQKEVALSITENIESTKKQDSSEKQSDCLRKSQEPTIARTRSKSKSKEPEITSKRSRSRGRTQEEQVLPVIEGAESVKNQDTLKRQSDRLRKSQEPTIARTRSKTKSEEPEITSKRNRSWSRTEEGRVSPVTEEAKSPKNQDTLKRPSESQEPIIARTKSESKSKEDESTAKRGSRSQDRMQNESTSAAVEKTESAKNQSDSRRHSDRLSKLPARSLAESMFEFEPEETAITSKRDTRNRVRVQKKSISITEKTESIKDQSDVKMHSDRLDSSQQYSTARSKKDSKSEEIESTAKRDSGSRNKAQKKSISAAARKIESGKIQDGSKKLSDRPSKSQRRSIAWLINDSDSEETEITPKQDSRSQRRPQKVSVSAVVERLPSNLLNRSDNLPTLSRILQIENGEELPESVPGSQSNRSKKSQLQHEKTIRESIPKKPSESFAKTAERFVLLSTDESEPEEAESQEKTQKIDSIRSQMPSVSMSADEMDAIDNAENSSTQNDRLIIEDNESEEEENRSLIGLREVEVENNTRKTNTGVTVSKRTSGARKETGHRDKAKDLMSPMVKTSVKSGSNILRGQKSITNFFKVDGVLPAAQVLSDKQKADEIKRKLDKLKELEMARMKLSREKNEEILHAREKRIIEIKKSIKKSKKSRPPKNVNEAYIMNGVVYSIARLSRPQKWITDRLYNYLWKCIEPKYKLDTKAVSEKFVVHMSNMTKSIIKHKSYLNYKGELHALMREMARLGIIHTRHDFYQFAHDFFPYELRAKTVPMILPGNERTIPYSPEKLHEPILDS